MDACRRRSGALAACLVAPLSALAAQPPEPTRVPTAATETAVPAEAGAFGAPVADAALSALRGGDGQVTVTADNRGTVEGNTASQVVTGGNRIDGGAFAHSAGLTTVIQNSGSNVLIQHGTALNVRFGDGR